MQIIPGMNMRASLGAKKPQQQGPKFGIARPFDREYREQNAAAGQQLVNIVLQDRRFGEKSRYKFTVQGLYDAINIKVDKSLKLDDVASALEAKLGGQLTEKSVSQHRHLDQITFKYQGKSLYLGRDVMMEIASL